MAFRHLLVFAGLVLAALAGAAPANGPAPEGSPALAATVACAGEEDDAPALNAAVAKIRARPLLSGVAWPVGRGGRLTVQGERCLLRKTLDLTHLYGSGFVLDLWGVEFVCQTAARTPLHRRDRNGTDFDPRPQSDRRLQDRYAKSRTSCRRARPKACPRAPITYMSIIRRLPAVSSSPIISIVRPDDARDRRLLLNYRDHAYAAIWTPRTLWLSKRVYEER